MHASQSSSFAAHYHSHSLLHHRHRHRIPLPFSTVSFRPSSSARRITSITTASSSSSSSSSTTAAAEPNLALSFYELLGISESGSLPQIKQAYKQLARKYHPDVSPPDRVKEYTQRFIMVQEAYETLSDPQRRAMYDCDMARSVHLAFSARRSYGPNEDLEGQNGWKKHWKSQLSELKRRSSSKEGCGDMSWGARMRRKRSESSSMEC